MNASTTMTIRLPADVKERLGRLASGTRRSRSLLATEALAAYVDRELATIEGIERGLADVAAGRVTPHDEAMDRVDAAIAEARKREGVARRVEWSDSALDDLLSQIAYVSADNPEAAQRIAGRVRETGAALGVFATGHTGRVSGTFEKSVARPPLIIAYALTEEDRVVSILRVIHAARDWRTDEWPD